MNVFINDIVDLFDSTCDPFIMGEIRMQNQLFTICR